MFLNAKMYAIQNAFGVWYQSIANVLVIYAVLTIDLSALSAL